MSREWLRRTPRLVDPADALPGRRQALAVPPRHEVLGTPMQGPVPAEMDVVLLGMGCFWGAERLFWRLPGVYVTAVGYAGGHTPNPSYEEVCSGMTAHAEVVRVVFDPALLPFEALLKVFWEGHDPTQGMRQGNDTGTQYRSVIYCSTPEQLAAATGSRERYAAALAERGHRQITTRIEPAPAWYFAEAYHQQYLHKHPGGYCGLGGTGVRCPGGEAPATQA